MINAIDTLQSWVTRLVRLVMKLTPYGVLALMTKVVAGSNLQDIIKLEGFVVVSYLGLGLMFVVHGLLVSAAGINPLRFFRKIWPVLTFAFTSRSSAATIPLSIEAQTRRLGIPRAIASFSASFGATIGQNGCANGGHQPVGSGVDRNPGCHRDLELGRCGRRRWWCDVRRVDRVAGHGLTGFAGGVADFRRASDRHGPHSIERQRLDHRRGDYQPGDAADRQGAAGCR